MLASLRAMRRLSALFLVLASVAVPLARVHAGRPWSRRATPARSGERSGSTQPRGAEDLGSLLAQESERLRREVYAEKLHHPVQAAARSLSDGKPAQAICDVNDVRRAAARLGRPLAPEVEQQLATIERAAHIALIGNYMEEARQEKAKGDIFGMEFALAEAQRHADAAGIETAKSQ
jgi:hypothetical protein